MSPSDEIVELFRRAAADRERGAAEIEEKLIGGLLEHEAELEPRSLHRGARLLAAGQPTMANLQSLAFAAENPISGAFFQWLEQRRLVLCELPERFAANGWPCIEPAEMVLTISRSTAVAAVVEGAWERGWKGSVVVFDGSASGRGPDQADRLSAYGKTISQPDAAMLHWLDNNAAVVVVGADGVGPESFVNSTGTRLLLEAARSREVEGVLVADTGKDVSQRVFDELVDGIPTHCGPQDRSWPIFEVIPLHFVNTRISE